MAEGRRRKNTGRASYLQELRCVTPKTGGPIYQKGVDGSKVCQICYFNMPLAQRREYIVLPWHNLVHKMSVYKQQKCAICGVQIVRIRAATQCQGCMQGYTVSDKTLLDYGWGVAVTTPTNGS